MKSEMTITAPNKHELRTRETRALLLAAAQTIFVRDGYEGAELGEIAALAGRTKGAIYAQFKSKEDIFLALIEDRTRCSRAQMEELLAKSTSVEGNLAALRSFYLQHAQDHAWSLLLLEFQLFAMRHPASKKRLQTLYAGAISPNDESRIAAVLGAAGKGRHAISRVVAIQALQPMISGLILQTQLETNLSGTNVVRKIISRVFDALMEVPAK
jgi:AcrR family transcriptional regulator